MNQPYFVVEFAHSVHGHAKRIQISYKWLAYLFGSFLLICLLAFGLFSSYLHMSWEVARYQQLRADFDGILCKEAVCSIESVEVRSGVDHYRSVGQS